MSNIIAFKPQQSAKDASRVDDLRGEILFFTGVRYVRDDVQDDPASVDAYLTDPAASDPMDGQDVERLKA